MMNEKITENETLTLVCEKINPLTQDGIFRYKGKVIIVKDVKPYFRYNIKITKVLPNYAFGVVV